MPEEKKIDWFNMTKEEINKMISKALSDSNCSVKLDEFHDEDDGDNRKMKYWVDHMVFDGTHCYLVQVKTESSDVGSPWTVCAYFEPKELEIKFENAITGLFKLLPLIPKDDTTACHALRDSIMNITVAYYRQFAKGKPWVAID